MRTAALFAIIVAALGCSTEQRATAVHAQEGSEARDFIPMKLPADWRIEAQQGTHFSIARTWEILKPIPAGVTEDAWLELMGDEKIPSSVAIGGSVIELRGSFDKFWTESFALQKNALVGRNAETQFELPQINNAGTCATLKARMRVSATDQDIWANVDNYCVSAKNPDLLVFTHASWRPEGMPVSADDISAVMRSIDIQ